jgi:signal transduction histidine kinase
MSTESTRRPIDDLSRSLLEAHDQERRRLAEELRENICQRLALCAVEIERLQQAFPDSPTSENRRLDTLRDNLLEVYTVVQSLSHELHSPVLEYVGLAAAMKSFCREFAERHHRSVEFSESDVPPSLPTEISTALFRVLQEGLNNIVAYRGSVTTEVKLHGRPDEIHLFYLGYWSRR